MKSWLIDTYDILNNLYKKGKQLLLCLTGLIRSCRKFNAEGVMLLLAVILLEKEGG